MGATVETGRTWAGAGTTSTGATGGTGEAAATGTMESWDGTTRVERRDVAVLATLVGFAGSVLVRIYERRSAKNSQERIFTYPSYVFLN
jgi:hypothetical protein